LEGIGPGDTNAWSSTSYFNSTSKWWSFARWNDDDALWGTSYANANCLGWANSQSSNVGTHGDPTKVNYQRWDNGNIACNLTNRLICVVDPILARAPTVNFTDLTNQTINTTVLSNIVQVTGIDLPVLFFVEGLGYPMLRVCANSSCTIEKQGWVPTNANSKVWVAPNDYIQLRIATAYVAGATVIATAYIGDTRDEWQVTTSGTAREQGYLVLSSGSWNGNLGGAAGADALCLTDLTNNTWMGKGSAGTLNSDRVKAFICEDASGRWCTLPNAYTKYSFAVSGNAAIGGGSIATDGGGEGPYDSQAWNTNSYFGGNYTYWMAFNSQTGFSYFGPGSQGQNHWLNFWSGSATNCNNWTSSSSSVNGGAGDSSVGSAWRWLDGWQTCDSTRKLVCMVGPDTIPNALSFTDLTNQTVSTLVTSNIVQVTGTASQDLTVRLEGAGYPTYRWCDNSTCTGTNSGWQSGGTIAPNYYIQLRTTTSSVAGTPFRVGVRVGNNTSPWYSWKVTTSGALPSKGYLVISETAWTAFQGAGGLSDMHANCLSELNTKTWLGKASAGTLNSTRVKAYLCDSTSCGNPVANTTYFYARAGSATVGGDAFTTDSSGNILTDTISWARSTAMGIDDTRLRTVRNMGGYCNNWTDNSGGYSYNSNMDGITQMDDWRRTQGYYGAACGTARMVCIVNP
jgi:hypothetical protein